MTVQKYSQERHHQVSHTTCAVYAFDVPFKLDKLYFQYRFKHFLGQRICILVSFLWYHILVVESTDVDGS